MTRRSYIQVDGVLYEKGTEPRTEAAMVMPDIAAYRSMIDGSMITSRSQHREHLHRHGYQEVGNDSSLYKPRAIPDCKPERRKEIIRQQIANMTNKEFNRAVQRTIDHWKWNSRS